MPMDNQSPIGCRGRVTSHRPASSHSHDGYLWIPRSWHRGGRRQLERSRSPRQHDSVHPPGTPPKMVRHDSGCRRFWHCNRREFLFLGKAGEETDLGDKVEKFYVSVCAGGLSLGARVAQAGRTPLNRGASSVHLSSWSCSPRSS
jgi:hypothetical protein